MMPGAVVETHGGLALVVFDDGTRSWLDMRTTAPPGAPVAPPVVATPVRINQRVYAPRSGAWGTGTVTLIHGKLAQVRYDDGAIAWLLATDLRG